MRALEIRINDDPPVTANIEGLGQCAGFVSQNRFPDNHDPQQSIQEQFLVYVRRRSFLPEEKEAPVLLERILQLGDRVTFTVVEVQEAEEANASLNV